MSVTERFAEFWSQVRRVEREIVQNGYGLLEQGRVPSPWECEDELMDEKLSKAYEAIETDLRKVTKRALFPTPPKLTAVSPFLADNAHQAVMFFINPTVYFLGAVDALRSPEYRAVKELASIEIEALKVTGTRIRDCQSVLRNATRTPRWKREAEAIAEMRRRIQEYHDPIDNPEHFKPLTQTKLAELLKVSQATISRMIPKVFPPNGMESYQLQFCNRQLRQGMINRDSSGGCSVDGIQKPEADYASE